MSEVKKHIIEENGIKREYVEVEREAKVGERVIVTNADVASYPDGDYADGDIATVTEIHDYGDEDYRTFFVAESDRSDDIRLYAHEYRVLEPIAPINAAEALADAVMEEEPLKQAVDLIANLAHRVTQLERKTGELVRAKHAEDDPQPDPEADVAAEPNMVEHPSHYTAGKFEVIDVIEDATASANGFEAYAQGNILKYVMRYRHKNGAEDLRKAAKYIEFLIEHLEGGR